MKKMVSRKRMMLALVGSASLGIALAAPAVAAGKSGNGGNPAGGFSSTTSSAPCNDGTVTASPAILWPPNHKLHTITVKYSESDNDGDTISITGIAESMVDGSGAANAEGHGAGQPTAQQGPDYVGPSNLPANGTDPGSATTSVQIRSERAGTVGNGSGRVYSLTVSCKDGMAVDPNDAMEAAGQSGMATVFVCVPHDMSDPSVQFCETQIGG